MHKFTRPPNCSRSLSQKNVAFAGNKDELVSHASSEQHNLDPAGHWYRGCSIVDTNLVVVIHVSTSLPHPTSPKVLSLERHVLLVEMTVSAVVIQRRNISRYLKHCPRKTLWADHGISQATCSLRVEGNKRSSDRLSTKTPSHIFICNSKDTTTPNVTG